MNSFRLAYALLRIPRLFASLFLIPILLSLLLVVAQLMVSGMIIKTLNRNAEAVLTNHREGTSFVRRIILGRGEMLPELHICRWEQGLVDGLPAEIPPADPACAPDRLDAALRVDDPATADPAPFLPILTGNIARLHLCKSCSPDIVIHPDGAESRTEISSIWALVLSSLFYQNTDVTDAVIEANRRREANAGLIGTRIFHSPGFRSAISMAGLETALVITINLAFLVIISLWLALKAHRKVLDYFARNGALLPMVAALGKGSFYRAIWLITIGRVGAFLAASVPLTYVTFAELMTQAKQERLFGADYGALALWAIALSSSLALATLVASIADLKQRHQLSTVLYRVVPIALSLLGAILWAFTFLFDGSTTAMLRNVIASLPIIGITPVLVAPVFKPQFDVLAIHAILTALLFFLTMRHNTGWFAAHLEEL